MTHRGFGVAVLVAIAAGSVSAQSSTTLGDVPHPRVAVVLSGGSAKGLAHIGALAVIEEMGIPIDLVTGTSMGAMIGGLYAAGYSPRALETLGGTADWNTFFSRPTDRRLEGLYEKREDERFTITFPLEHGRPSLPSAVLPRQSVAVHLERYLWPVNDVADFMQLPTAFGALVTDLATGEPILIRAGSLAQVIEGSAAVPGAFAPLKLADGRTVVDGAVNRNIPAEDARALGADLLICVDVSERIAPVDSLHSLVDILDQTVSFRVQMSNAVERPLCNVVIEPETGQLSSADFSQSAEWVRRGRAASLARRPELQAIADSVHRLRGRPLPRRALPAPDSVFVRRIEWSHVSRGADLIAQGAMTLHDSAWVTQSQVEACAARLFATGRFDQVSYRIAADSGNRVLVFDLTEGDRDVLGLGVRYDTPRGVALLASASAADVISPGSTASLSVRLGADQQFDVRDVLGERLNSRFLQTYHLTATRTALPSLTVAGASAPVVLDVRQATAQLERTLVTGVALGIDGSREWIQDGTAGGADPFALRTQSLTIVGATLSWDTRDRIAFPTQGTALLWRTEVGLPPAGGSGFARHVGAAAGALPVGRGVSLEGSAHWGSAGGADLPLHDWFFLGGSVRSELWPGQFIPFDGIDPQSVAGRSVRVAQVGVQAQAPAAVTVAVRGDLGGVFDGAPANEALAGYRTGVGLTVGREFAPGPISISFGTRAWSQRPVVQLEFGARF